MKNSTFRFVAGILVVAVIGAFVWYFFAVEKKVAREGEDVKASLITATNITAALKTSLHKTPTAPVVEKENPAEKPKAPQPPPPPPPPPPPQNNNAPSSVDDGSSDVEAEAEAEEEAEQEAAEQEAEENEVAIDDAVDNVVSKSSGGSASYALTANNEEEKEEINKEVEKVKENVKKIQEDVRKTKKEFKEKLGKKKYEQEFKTKPTGGKVTYEVRSFDNHLAVTSVLAERINRTTKVKKEGAKSTVPETEEKEPAKSPSDRHLYNDTDQDGLSDFIEDVIGTDVEDSDSDNDGRADGEEVNNDGSDPTDKKSNAKESDMIAITNVSDGATVPERGMVISGVAPKGTVVEIFLIDGKGQKQLLGTVTATDNNRFIFKQGGEDVSSGDYLLYVQEVSSPSVPSASILPSASAQGTEVKRSQTVVIGVAKAEELEVSPPELKQIADKELDQNVFLRSLRVDITDNRPVLRGIAPLGTTVVANWESALFSSAIIAGVEGGLFESVSPTTLDVGEHDVVVYAKSSGKKITSESVGLGFRITEKGEVIVEDAVTPDTAVPTETVAKNSYMIPGVAIAAVLLLILVILALKRRKKGV